MDDLILSKYTKLKDSSNNNLESVKKNRASAQEVLQFYGSSPEEQKMNEHLAAEANAVFAERYNQVIPEKSAIETRITDTVRGVFRAKDIGYFEEGKRANHAKSRIQVQRHLHNEQYTYVKRSEDIRHHLSTNMNKGELARLKERYQSPEEMEALQQWMVSEVYNPITDDTMTEDLFGGLSDESGAKRGLALRKIALSIPRLMKPEDFAFKNDREFVSNFAKKYELLSKAASAEVFVRQLEELVHNGEYVLTYSLVECKATIALCKRLKALYEERMELIRSPYYALLAKKDLEAYEQPDGTLNEEKLQNEINADNEEFVNYLKRYLRLKNDPLGKGKDIRAEYNILLTDIQNDTYERDAAALYDIGFDPNKSAEENFNTMYENGRFTHLKENEDKSDPEYLNSTPLHLGEAKVEGLDEKNIMELEKLLVEICEKKTINGVPVKDEDVKDVKNFVKQAAEKRKEINALYKGLTGINGLSSGVIDTKNPAFAKQPYAKTLTDVKDMMQTYYREHAKLSPRYITFFLTEIKKLAAKGYSILPELENKFNDEKTVDDAVEFYRKEIYQPRYYRKYPPAEGEEKKPVALPTFTVNGKTFCTYAVDESYEILAGLTIVLDEKSEEALKLLDKIEPLTKKLSAINATYGNEDGQKGLVGSILNTKLNKEREPLVAELMHLLKDKVPEVKDYMDNHPEKFRLK